MGKALHCAAHKAEVGADRPVQGTRPSDVTPSRQFGLEPGK